MPFGPSQPDLMPGARNAVGTCLAIQSGEQVALIADQASAPVAASLASALDERGARTDAVLIESAAGQEQPSNDDAHKYQEHRLDECHESLHVGRNFFIEEIGDGVEHLLQRAGRLAYLGHLDGDFWEDVTRFQGGCERRPFSHASADDLELLRNELIADRPRRDIK